MTQASTKTFHVFSHQNGEDFHNSYGTFEAETAWAAIRAAVVNADVFPTGATSYVAVESDAKFPDLFKEDGPGCHVIRDGFEGVPVHEVECEPSDFGLLDEAEEDDAEEESEDGDDDEDGEDQIGLINEVYDFPNTGYRAVTVNPVNLSDEPHACVNVYVQTPDQNAYAFDGRVYIPIRAHQTQMSASRMLSHIRARPI